MNHREKTKAAAQKKYLQQIIIVVIALLLLPQAFALEKITEQIHDEAEILSAEQENILRTKLSQLQEQNIAEIAIVTVPTLDGKIIEEYAISLAHDTLGDQETDNGLLLLVALEERAWRIEIGYGLEGNLTDGDAGYIGRTYLVPAFQQERYFEGILTTVEALEFEITGEIQNAQTSAGTKTPTTDTLSLIVTLLVLFLIISSRFGLWFLFFPSMGRSMGRGGFSSGGGFGGGGFGGGGAGGRW